MAPANKKAATLKKFTQSTIDGT